MAAVRGLLNAEGIDGALNDVRDAFGHVAVMGWRLNNYLRALDDDPQSVARRFKALAKEMP